MHKIPCIDDDLILRISNAIENIAFDAVASCDPLLADRCHRLAADVELLSPAIQECWGGAFNGQSQRKALVVDLMTRLKFSLIIETGTYRGVTTEWLAERFEGPIWTCENSPRYFHQAKSRLSRFSNVKVCLAKSPEFLDMLMINNEVNEIPFAYLDAHWEDYLPLAEEIKILMERYSAAVIMVDDFRVPEDSNYEWDNYGMGKRIDLEQIRWLKEDSTAQIFLPKISGIEESGARRGVCVIAIGVSETVSRSPYLRSVTDVDWISSAEASRALDSADEQRDCSPVRVSSVEDGNLRRSDLRGQIHDIWLQTRGLRTREARDIIDTWYDAVEAAMSDHIARQTYCEELERKLNNTEKDSAARLSYCEELERKITFIEEDRAARLVEIRRLDAALLRSEGDRAARLAEIERRGDEIMRFESEKATLLAYSRELERKINLDDTELE